MYTDSAMDLNLCNSEKHSKFYNDAKNSASEEMEKLKQMEQMKQVEIDFLEMPL